MATSKTIVRNKKIDPDIQANIQSLGLTQSEVRIYLAVLELGKTTVSAVANYTELNRRNIYDALSTLIDKGLIFLVIGEKEGHYGAVTPEKLLELVQSKKIALDNIMPELQNLYKKEFKPERATIYKGLEGFKGYLQDILNIGEDIYCLGAKGGWGYKELGDYADWFTQERIKRKLRVFNLFDSEMRGLVTKNDPLYKTFSEQRFLPPEFSTNSAIDTFGDHVVTFTGLYPEKFNEDVTLFVIVSEELAEAQRTWFKFLWDHSPEA